MSNTSLLLSSGSLPMVHPSRPGTTIQVLSAELAALKRIADRLCEMGNLQIDPWLENVKNRERDMGELQKESAEINRVPHSNNSSKGDKLNMKVAESVKAVKSLKEMAVEMFLSADASETIHGETDVAHLHTFVKVYKSGSPVRMVEIDRFSNYHELRKEVGRMFGIEDELEDPVRSGWQVVFVDRENDLLLYGDDPWESFVNSVWYVKVLSPEDISKMSINH